MSIYHITLALFAITLLLYLWIKQKYDYWNNLKVPSPKFHYQDFICRPPNAILFKRYYDEFKSKGPFCGFYVLFQPLLLITDLNLIKNIFVKDFPIFLNRGTPFHDDRDPLNAHLFNLEGMKWKNLRAKLTPTFTSGKMKYMFPTIVVIAEEFKQTIQREAQISKELELKDILARFTTDVIGSVAFGLECNSLQDPTSKFREYGLKVISFDWYRKIKMMFKSTFPEFSDRFDINLRDEEANNFFLDLIKQTVEHREKNNVRRNDFMDLLIDIKAKSSSDDFTDNDLAANAFVFYLAGFETSSTAMYFALFELARNQNIQDKARAEVKRVLEEHNGELTYESMKEMKYILQILNESLRKYPPLAELSRRCEIDYKEPQTGFVFKMGTRLHIPVYAIHHDPDYYPNPDVFDPDRFTDEQVQNRNPYSFLPFGEGPRNCIGMRFGIMQSRIGLATLLNNFKFTPTARTPQVLELDENGLILTGKGGLWLNVEQQ
jgi:cytochrome P450 family 6